MRTRVLNSLLADMAVFVQVADHGSFAKAARTMSMTPSALSRQVTRLEDALSHQLLERSTQNLRLTDFGRDAYVLCRRIVDSAGEVVDLAQNVQETPQGVLRVSAPRAFGTRVVHPLINEFLNTYPEIDVQLVLTDRHVDPVIDELDLVIDITEMPRRGYISHTICEVKQCLCASPEYLALHGKPKHPEDLRQHACITLGELGERNDWVFTKGSERITICGRGRYSVNNTDLRLDCVLNHQGIAAMPDFTAEAELASKKVVPLLPGWSLSAAYRGFAYIQHLPTKHLATKADLFVQFLLDSKCDKSKLESG